MSKLIEIILQLFGTTCRNDSEQEAALTKASPTSRLTVISIRPLTTIAA